MQSWRPRRFPFRCVGCASAGLRAAQRFIPSCPALAPAPGAVSASAVSQAGWHGDRTKGCTGELTPQAVCCQVSKLDKAAGEDDGQRQRKAVPSVRCRTSSQ